MIKFIDPEREKLIASIDAQKKNRKYKKSSIDELVSYDIRSDTGSIFVAGAFTVGLLTTSVFVDDSTKKYVLDLVGACNTFYLIKKVNDICRRVETYFFDANHYYNKFVGHTNNNLKRE